MQAVELPICGMIYRPAWQVRPHNVTQKLVESLHVSVAPRAAIR
jgi:hypothetical protein